MSKEKGKKFYSNWFGNDSNDVNIKVKDDQSANLKTGLTKWGGTYNLVAYTLGTAMLYTGNMFSLITSSYLGFLVEVLIGLFSFLSCWCMFSSAVEVRATSFNDLGKKVFGESILGKIGSFILITFPTMLGNWGSLSAYLETVSATIGFYVEDVNPLLIQIPFALLMTLLGTVKTYNYARLLSIFVFCVYMIVMAISLTTGGILINNMQVLPNQPFTEETGIELNTSMTSIPHNSFNFWVFIQAFPLISVGLNPGPSLPGMAGEMHEKNYGSFVKYIFLALTVIVICNCLAGVLPSNLFGICTSGNAFENYTDYFRAIFCKTSIPIAIANFLLPASLFAQTPIFHIIQKEFLLDRNGKTVRDYSYTVNALCSFAIALVSYLFGVILGDIVETMNIISTFGSLICAGFTAPLLVLMCEKTTGSKIRGWVLMVLGIIFLIINVYNVQQTFATSEASGRLSDVCNNIPIELACNNACPYHNPDTYTCYYPESS